MYRISSEKEALAIRLFLSGHTGRMVADEAGINKNTAWTLGRKVREAFGTIYCQCGKVSGHKDWCGFRISKSPARTAYMAGVFRDVGSLNIYIPSRPRYERPDIANERETEIPLLVNRRSVASLDATVFDGGNSRHEIIACDNMTPLEALMMKEEIESREYAQRIKDIRLFERFTERKTSAFYIR